VSQKRCWNLRCTIWHKPLATVPARASSHGKAKVICRGSEI